MNRFSLGWLKPNCIKLIHIPRSNPDLMVKVPDPIGFGSPTLAPV